MPQDPLIGTLISIAGKRHVLTGEAATRRYRKGFRYGDGKVLAVVAPATLVEQWRIAKACLAAGKIILMQAANTGLTGGSTPDGDDYDRDIVIISTLRMDKIHLLEGGRQVLCLPGATLYQLENILRPLGREPHSVIGSSCIGASVLGGVCNNSGGALIHRGPAYTQLSLFARQGEDGALELVNNLGIALRGAEEEILERLERGDFASADVLTDAGAASAADYAVHVRDVAAETPARFNADPKRLFEASGCAGKLMVFAVRLDTFPAPANRQMFYIGTNAAADLTAIRRDMLAGSYPLPVSAEYMHREAYDIAAIYGKDTFLAIHWFGTGFLPKLFALKSYFDALCEKAKMPALADRLLQGMAKLLPHHLPKRLQDYRARYAHYLMIVAEGQDAAATEDFLSRFFETHDGGYFKCTGDEAARAHLHRFVAAGAGLRYRALQAAEVEDMLALDIALRRNDDDWFETLPVEIETEVAAKLYYGHFFCHVFHQDYLLKKGADVAAVKTRMLAALDARGAEYPAEHNVGHVYTAKPALKNFYRQLDPCNSFNPGIGQTSKRRNWQ